MILKCGHIWGKNYFHFHKFDLTTTLRQRLSLISVRNAVSQQTTDTGCYNERPVIGVLAQASKGKRKNFGDQYFAASYVKWLEAAGARVVPVKINQTESYYEDLFSSLNGILFPGGGQNLLESGYANAARWFFRRSKNAFDESGDYFPIWGTCLGFEQLLVLSEEKKNLDRCNATQNRAMKTKFVPGVESRLLTSPAGLTASSLRTMTSEDYAAHFHKWGMWRENFDKNERVKEVFKIVATSVDGDNKEIVDIIEGKRYPFYGTQFHPEKNIFEWARRLSRGINHSRTAIRVSFNLAEFFVEETRRSCHKFANPDVEDAALIYNYQPTETGQRIQSVFHQCYFFNVTDGTQAEVAEEEEEEDSDSDGDVEEVDEDEEEEKEAPEVEEPEGATQNSNEELVDSTEESTPAASKDSSAAVTEELVAARKSARSLQRVLPDWPNVGDRITQPMARSASGMANPVETDPGPPWLIPAAKGFVVKAQLATLVGVAISVALVLY